MTTTSRWTTSLTCRRLRTIPEAIQAVRGSAWPSPDRAPAWPGKNLDPGAFSACSPRRRPVNDAHTARRAAPATERTLKSGQVWGLSSVGRALAWHARGQGFDSPRLHQISKKSPITIRRLSAAPTCATGSTAISRAAYLRNKAGFGNEAELPAWRERRFRFGCIRCALSCARTTATGSLPHHAGILNHAAVLAAVVVPDCRPAYHETANCLPKPILWNGNAA